MFDRILVPTDGSDIAETGAEAAIVLAREFDAELHVVHVLEPDERPPDEDEGEERRSHRREEATNAVAEMAADADVEATVAVLESDDSVHEVILDYAAEHSVDCIVMGTTGRTGLDRYVLGSVAEKTIRKSSVPVVSVHEDTDIGSAFDSVLIPTDGSDYAQAAATHAIELALATEAALHIVHVVDVGVVTGSVNAAAILDALEEAGELALQEVIDQAEEAGVSVIEATVLGGSPYRAIVKYADEHDIDLLAMGTHGRTGVDRYFLGSVTERVVRRTEVPVLVVSIPNQTE